jgi:putative ABC transport system permease protein
MVKALDRKLLRDLVQLKGQVLTVALVVACGVAGFVTFQSTWESLEHSKRTYYERYRFAHAFVTLKRAPESVARRLEAIPGVALVYTRVVQTVNLPLPGHPQSPIGEIVSLPDAAQPPLDRLILESGRLPEQGRGEEAVLLTAFARRNRIVPGDRILAVINGKLQDLRIVGLASSPEFVYPQPPGGGTFADDERFAVLWMDRAAIAPAFQMEGAFNDALFRLQPGASEAGVLREIDRILEPYGGFTAVGQDRQSSNYIVREEMAQLKAWATVVPLIFLSVSAFLVNVVLSRLVSLQRPEIATLKAVGYTNGGIGLHFLKLVSVVVLLGGAAGLALGAVLGRGLTALYTDVFHFPLFSYRVSLLVMVAGGAVSLAAAAAGAATAVRGVVRLTPAEAMRPPAPAVYRPLLSERLGLDRFISQAVRMILRELERRPLRLVLSALGIGACIAILVVGRISQDAIDTVLDVQFQRAWREDLSVTFRDPLPDRVVGTLGSLPGVLRAEGLRTVAARVDAGHRSRDVAMVGYPDAAELRRVVSGDGREVPLPLAGALVSAQLGRALRVRAGDTLAVKVLEGDRRTLRLPVSGLVDDMAGLQVYLRKPLLEQLLGTAPSSNAAALTVEPTHRLDVERRLTDMPQVAAVSDRPAAIRKFRKETGTSMLIISAVLTAFAATIAVGVVYNNARVALSLRSRDLASLRVLGFTRGEVSGILLSELAAQVVVALPLGLLLSRWFTHWVVNLSHPERFRLPDEVSPRRLAFAVMVTLLASAASGLLVRRQLDHLDLIGVLKTRE